MSGEFIQVYKNAFLHPRRTFIDLIRNKHHLRLSMLSVLVMATLYSCVYLFLIFGGGRPFKPWLAIPEDIYYQYNIFFCAPSMFLGWILAAGVVHALSRIFTTAGNFEHILAVFGFGLSVASWTTGLHDLISSFLGAVGLISQSNFEVALNSPTIWRALLWVLMTAYLLMFVWLFSVGVSIVYACKKWQSLILGITGFLIYQLFFLIFNR